MAERVAAQRVTQGPAQQRAPLGESQTLITVKRSGGYAGTVEEWSLDTSTQDDRARTVEQLAQQLVALGDRSHAGFDLERYEITVADGSGRRTIIIDDDGSADSAQLRELIELLPRRG